MDFTGKVAVVTGASVGIGLATAQELASGHCDLVLVDLNYEKLLEIKKDLEKSFGVDVMAFECDVSDEARVKEVCAEALEHFGHIGILVNNAGIWRRWMPFLETDSGMWKQYIGVNVLGAMYFTQALLGGMIEDGWGRVINIASVAGVYGNANMVDYSMTKAALIGFTKALAKEVADKGVTVNAVSPGSVSDVQETPMPSELSFMGRSGAHSEYAHLIVFLAGDEGSYISAQNYQVDGCRKKQ